MELKVNKKLLIKNLIEYNMEFYIPSYLIRNYSDDEEVVKVIDWSRNSESYLNFRVQIEGHYNKASSTGDYYIISSRLEDFIDYFNNKYTDAFKNNISEYNKMVAHLYNDYILNCKYILEVEYPKSYNNLHKYIACNMELDFENKPIYLEIESKSNKSIIVRVLKAYNHGSTGYINSRSSMFPRKILRVITDLKDIDKKFEPTTSEESSEKWEVTSSSISPTPSWEAAEIGNGSPNPKL